MPRRARFRFDFWDNLSRKCMKNEKGGFGPESSEEMVDNAMLFTCRRAYVIVFSLDVGKA